MSRCPACRAYSASTWKQIHSRLGGSSANRPPGEAVASSGKSRSTARVRSPIARSRSTSSSAVTSGATYQRPVGVLVPRLVDGPVAPRLVDLLAEEAPDEPPLLHVQHVLKQLDRRPARRQPRACAARSGDSASTPSTISSRTQSRYAAQRALAGRAVLGRLARVAADAVVLGHVPSIRLPSSSQCAATFFDGCTRGGSPGIFG